MGHRGRLTLLLLLLASCKQKTAVVSSDAGRPDQLGSQEFPEAKESAFALPIPRGSHISYHYRIEYIVDTPLTPEQLANFVQARVTGGTVVRGTSSTEFENAAAKNEPGRLLEISIRTARVGRLQSELHVKDVTPPPLDPKMSEADRWKAVGLTPDGKPIDRKNLQ